MQFNSQLSTQNGCMVCLKTVENHNTFKNFRSDEIKTQFKDIVALTIHNGSFVAELDIFYEGSLDLGSGLFMPLHPGALQLLGVGACCEDLGDLWKINYTLVYFTLSIC